MRIEGYGRVDRDAPLSFSLDGKTYGGFSGDTLASALLANDVRLMGRSFKYHRPRGVLTAGSEEPNALVTIGDEPNLRAPMVELYDGLVAASQNCWPSLRYDLLSANDLGAPFLSAGFYYKTFMWPRAFWEKVYEPAIRRAAGLGALSGAPNADIYEKAFAFCDVLVIGAGPSGLIAALSAAEAGADVILCDEGPVFGGQLLSEDEEVGDLPGHVWAADMVDRLRAMDNVRLMQRTTVTGAYDQGTFGAVERVGVHLAEAPEGLPRECFWRIAAQRAVLTAGAIERPIAFANNDRPGVMMASAVRSYLHRHGAVAGSSVAVFGNNDNAHRTARDLAAAGVHVAALIDSRSDVELEGDFPTYKGARVIGTKGRRGLTELRLATPEGERIVRADCLAMSGGWNPSVHLTCHMNGRPIWNEALQSFVPTPDAVPGLVAAGAANGRMSTHDCLEDGAAAGRALAENLGFKLKNTTLPKAENAPYRLTPLWDAGGRGRAWLDFQNDVTTKDVRQAARENYRSVEHMKRYTTQGMATDQGKSSNVAALAILADATGRNIPETGTTTFRPPYVPVALATLGAGAQGKGFAPERLTSSHAASVAMGAPMIEAGLWYRPSYFPRTGERNWRQSCDREVSMVRKAVGICDVSTLGKIDIQGPDAASLLDFVYTGTFSTLAEARVRYGLMLREDGFAMDDGTTARLGPEHYLMTTTTVAAGQVMAHLELARDVLKPGLDVGFSSVTEQWAQFAVAGPKSRTLLNALLDEPIDDARLPFMGYLPVSLLGTAARLFRISFSGEQAYELAVPTRYGDALFRLLVSQAEAMGGGAYGMEALNVLRLEKGLLTHAEIHGRVTARDLGLSRICSKKKDYIGCTAAMREGFQDSNREQLVGLKPVGAVRQLTAGMHLFAEDSAAVRVNDQGYVTSVGFSPTLGHFIGLAFLKSGRERHGEVIRAVDHLNGLNARVEVSPPVFVDPEGGRLRG